jgi:orotidine-5'-phosphate decarboxylase
MFFEKLQNRVAEVNSLLCVGLDPHPKHVCLPPLHFSSL